MSNQVITAVSNTANDAYGIPSADILRITIEEWRESAHYKAYVRPIKEKEKEEECPTTTAPRKS